MLCHKLLFNSRVSNDNGMKKREMNEEFPVLRKRKQRIKHAIYKSQSGVMRSIVCPRFKIWLGFQQTAELVWTCISRSDWGSDWAFKDEIERFSMKWDIPGLCTIGTPHEGFSVAVHTDFEWPSADGFNLILSLIGFYKPLSQSLPRTATVDTANQDMARKWT
jgi:hypothetical protein